MPLTLFAFKHFLNVCHTAARKLSACFYDVGYIEGRPGFASQHEMLDFLREKRVLIVPGSGFEWEKPDHFRIVMLPEPDTLYNAMMEIGDFLEAYQQK